MSLEKVVLITRPTRLQESVKRYNTKAQAKFYVEKRGQSFSDYELEEETYQRARDHVLKAIPSDLKVQVIDRSFLTNYLFTPHDMVVCLGQDGLVVNTAKYLSGQPVVAINPDPARFDGVLLPFQQEQTENVLRSVAAGNYEVRKITMARVDLNDGQHLYAFNDLFLGPKSHITARYTLHMKGQSERQMSSGILVSTPAGSTGWMSSLFNQTRGIATFTGLKNNVHAQRLNWEEKKLMFLVREPFASKWSTVNLVAGTITPGIEFRVESHMGESGVIFSDGMETDYLEFNTGSTASVSIAEKATDLVVKIS
jgi:NAD kinase